MRRVIYRAGVAVLFGLSSLCAVSAEDKPGKGPHAEPPELPHLQNMLELLQKKVAEFDVGGAEQPFAASPETLKNYLQKQVENISRGIAELEGARSRGMRPDELKKMQLNLQSQIEQAIKGGQLLRKTIDSRAPAKPKPDEPKSIDLGKMHFEIELDPRTFPKPDGRKPEPKRIDGIELKFDKDRSDKKGPIGGRIRMSGGTVGDRVSNPTSSTLKMSANGKHAAVVGSDGSVRVFNVPSGEEIMRFGTAGKK